MSDVLNRIGHGIRRMLWFPVAPAVIAAKELVETLGRDAMITEDHVASALGCGKDYVKRGKLSWQRYWKKIDIGFKYVNGWTMHYENNTPPFYVKRTNKFEPYKPNSAVFAVLAHDIKALMGSKNLMTLFDIANGLNQMAHRPWPTWSSYRAGFGKTKTLSAHTLGRLLVKANIPTKDVWFPKTRTQPACVRSESLDWWLKRYPAPPELDMSQYTREPVYKKAYNQETGESFDRGGTPIYYNVGELQDWLSDPYPMLKQRVGDSETEIVYCVSGSTQHTNRGNQVLKIGFSREVATFAERLRTYRCTSVMPIPTVEWAIEVPTRLVLEKRLHNIYLDRMICECYRSGGELFEGSPVRWSPERMLRDATEIVESYGHKHRRVKESDLNRSQREISQGCLWV